MLLLAYALSFGAAFCYGVSTIFQAISVRRIRTVEALPNPSSPQRLRAYWLYALGLLTDGFGFLAVTLALQWLPLFFVEAVSASSVAITALLSVVVLGQRLAGSEIRALVVLIGGLAALAVTAQEGHALAVASWWGWLLLFALVPLVIVALCWRKGLVWAVLSGVGFALVGIAARLFEAPSTFVGWLQSGFLWTLVAAGVLAILCYGFALDRLPATTVAAVSFSLETVLPAVVGVFLFGDAVRSGWAWLALVGFLCTLGACLYLARFSEVEV